jgi:outer membrane protein insertion porin family
MMGTAAQLTADLTKSATSYLKHSSFVEKLVGGGVACKFGSADGPSGAHDFGYRLQLRDVCKLPQGVASWSILQQRGASLKSALSHTFAATRLDEPMAPTSGGAIRLHTELAGVAPPLGDVSFVKQTLTASAFVPLLPAGRVAVGAFLNAGLLLPLGQNAKRESSVCDRFFLGGPGSLWGFRTRGCGPRELRHNPTGAALGERAPRDTLGGDVMAVATGIVSVALPGSKLEAARVRAHAFGSVGGLTTLSALNAAGGSFAPSLRACAGIGEPTPQMRQTPRLRPPSPRNTPVLPLRSMM